MVLAVGVGFGQANAANLSVKDVAPDLDGETLIGQVGLECEDHHTHHAQRREGSSSEVGVEGASCSASPSHATVRAIGGPQHYSARSMSATVRGMSFTP